VRRGKGAIAFDPTPSCAVLGWGGLGRELGCATQGYSCMAGEEKKLVIRAFCRGEAAEPCSSLCEKGGEGRAEEDVGELQSVLVERSTRS